MFTYAKEQCIGCGKVWNVSAHAQIPTFGYICPHCESPGQKTIKPKRNYGVSNSQHKLWEVAYE